VAQPPQLPLGPTVNLAVRAAMLLMLAEVIRASPDDHRFAGKGIATRFTVFALPATFVVPALWARARWRGRSSIGGSPAVAASPSFGGSPVVAPSPSRRSASQGPPYPWTVDALYISLFALDLAGNVFDWYDRYFHFDLIPHAHGGGAIAILFAWLFGWPASTAVRASIAGHALLEAQEYASDVAFGLRNVRGWWDVVGDLGAGVVGAVAYAAAYQRWVRDAGREPESPLRWRAAPPPQGSGP
jgi:hypothetical protein